VLSVIVLAVEAEAESRGARLSHDQRTRLRSLYAAHADLVWRLMRRHGLTSEQADDGLQQVFMVALQRLEAIQPGSERSFLCSSAILIGRGLMRRKEELPGELPESESESGPAEALELKRRRALLQKVLDQMDVDLRMVLVLQDIEGLSKREAAEALGIPEGTVASRTRRARDEFRALLSQQVGEP